MAKPKTHKPVLSHPVFQEPVFSEAQKAALPTSFQEAHPSDSDIYKQIEDLLTKDVVSFEKSRVAPGEVYKLQDAFGPRGEAMVKQITDSGRVVFHAVGDTGCSNQRKYRDEVGVADQLTQDAYSANPADRPSFAYHLGDVVYDFGESRYYYDQFYDPFRNYPGPIFAVPGNHDSFVIPGTPDDETPLTTFSRNFCNTERVITPEAASLHRTAMTQPGVYFALDAPFVRVIGLFSNALEDPGVISSQNGKWKTVPDYQLEYLSAQLKSIKDEKYAGAVLIAVHHPPFAYHPEKASDAQSNHSSSSDMLRQIDEICKEQGVYPHAFVSAHAHNYQRYTREIKFSGQEYDVPFIVCGDGGHNVNALVRTRRGEPSLEPVNGSKVDYLENKPAVQSTSLILEKYEDHNFGYLRISATKDQLHIGFHEVGVRSILQSRYDLVTVDLKSHQMVAN
jgi:hypothetical protein